MNASNWFKTLLIILCLGTSIPSSAQIINDTLIYFKAPLELSGNGASAIKGTPGLRVVEKSVFVHISQQAAVKAKLPSSVQTSAKPVVLRHQGTCYLFKSASAGKNSQLIWLDRNRDGIVQPLKELRSLTKEGEAGKIVVTKVPCK